MSPPVKSPIAGPRTHASAALLLLVVSTSACASTGRLGEYDFNGRSLTVVVDAPRHPEVFDSSVPMIDDDEQDTLGDVFARVGSALLRDVSAAEAQQRLSAAADRVNPAELIGTRALERSARILRMEPVADGAADFELELRIERYGLTSNDWNAQAFFMVEGRMFLIDSADGSVVWETGLSEYDAVNRGDTDLGDNATNVVTAAIFATLSEDQMATALEAVAQHAADHAADRLRAGFDKARGR